MISAIGREVGPAREEIDAQARWSRQASSTITLIMTRKSPGTARDAVRGTRSDDTIGWGTAGSPSRPAGLAIGN